jgi:hypothetical protein
VNVENSDLTRRFGRTRAVPGVKTTEVSRQAPGEAGKSAALRVIHGGKKDAA